MFPGHREGMWDQWVKHLFFLKMLQDFKNLLYIIEECLKYILFYFHVTGSRLE
jgi:hypothetical protein